MGIIGLVVTVCVFFADMIEVDNNSGDGSMLFTISILVLIGSTLSLAAGSALAVLRDIAINFWYTRQPFIRRALQKSETSQNDAVSQPETAIFCLAVGF